MDETQTNIATHEPPGPISSTPPRLHPKAAFASGHQTHASSALMRKAVKKPEPSIKRKVRVVGTTDTLQNRTLVAAVTPNASLIKPLGRLNKNQPKRSPLITHFSQVSLRDSSTANTVKTLNPQPASFHYKSPPQISPIHNPAKHRSAADLLDRALEKAVSHEQPPHKLSKKGRTRLAGTWVASALLLLVIFYGISQNLTNLKLQVASAKAGFTATLPRDMPSGFSLNQLAYARGNVGVSFKSNSSNQNYAIIQRASSWNDQTLQASYLKPSYPGYVAESSSGLTVYIFGNHNATWVSNGIWYTIQSNGTLSDHELMDMASST